MGKKLVTLDQLTRFYEGLKGTYDTALDVNSENPVQNKAIASSIQGLQTDVFELKHTGVAVDPTLLEDETIAKSKLEKNVQDTLDSVADKEDITTAQATKKELEDAINDIKTQQQADEADITTIREAEKANAQAASNAVTAINNTNTALNELAKDKDADVTALNAAITSTNTALAEVRDDVTGIKTDLAAVDGLNDLKAEVEGISQVVDALETAGLTTYVKKEDFDEMLVQYKVLDEDTKEVEFYTKDETTGLVTEKLGSYVTSDTLQSYKYYNEEKTAAKIKEMMLNGDGDSLNQGLLEKTASYIQTQYTSYVENTLKDYSTTTQTSDAITTAVGDLETKENEKIDGAVSTINQRAGVIEASITAIENNVATNYYDKTATANLVTETLVSKELLDSEGAINVYTKAAAADYVSSQLSSYYTKTDADGAVAEALKDYSTITQTASEIKAELYQAGLTESAESLTKVVCTPAEVKSTVTQMANNGETIASRSYVDQKSDSITLAVGETNDDVAANAAQISILKSQVSMAVTNNADGLDGNKIITAINIGDGSIAIDGQYVHVTGDTVFDEDVEIKGNMTAGSINCDSGVSINAGAVSIDSTGMTVKNTVTNGAMVLDSNGMNFKDSNGNVFAQMGRSAFGTCQNGDAVELKNWDVAPKVVLLTPYSMQTGVANYTASNIYTKCFPDIITKGVTPLPDGSGTYDFNGFKCNCYTTIAGGSYSTGSIAAAALNQSRNASDYADVSKEVVSGTFTAPTGATQTVLSGQVTFYSGYNTSHDAAITSSNADLTAPAGATLTVTATPTSSKYVVDTVDIAAASGGANGDNCYTVSLGSHDNINIAMSANTNVDWNKAGYRAAYIDIYVNDTLTKTVTVYVGAASYGKNIPCTTDSVYQLNETISHAAGATIKLKARATWTYKVDTYKINIGDISCTANVTGDVQVSEGQASYLALG